MMGYIAKSITPSFINILSNMNFSFSIKRGIYFPFLNLNLLMTWLWPIKHNGSDMPVPSPGLSLSCIFSLFLLELCPAAMRTCLRLLEAERSCGAETKRYQMRSSWISQSPDDLATDCRCMDVLSEHQKNYRQAYSLNL